MVAEINVLSDFVLDDDGCSRYIYQFFFAYPRFRIRDGSIAERVLDLFIKKHTVGDGMKKLKFSRSWTMKFGNGVAFVYGYVVADRSFDLMTYGSVRRTMLRFYVAPYEGCGVCSNNFGGFCDIFGRKILDKKYKCDFWEERVKTKFSEDKYVKKD